MADLPDLDTTDKTFTAFWNALDYGVTSIDPEEALSAGKITEYTLYDNGWEGKYSNESGLDLGIRVKSDGWFVAYLFDTEQTATDTSNLGDLYGIWDILPDWHQFNAQSGLTENTLERAIQSLASELSNWGDIIYNPADVGLYDYSHPDAGEYVVVSGSYSGGTTTSAYTYSDKNIHEALVVSSATNDEGTSGAVLQAIFDPNAITGASPVVLFDESDTIATKYGVAYVTSRVQDAGVEYESSYGAADAIGYEDDCGYTNLIWASDAV